jgi:hypothetical protein
MTLAPLLSAPAVIQFHAGFAFAAIGLGAAQLLAPKGTLSHRTKAFSPREDMLLRCSRFLVPNFRMTEVFCAESWVS